MKLTKRKDGRWQYNFSPGKGQKPVTFYSSEEEWEKAEKEIIDKIAGYKAKSHAQKHNFKILAEKMIEQKETEIGFQTTQNYKFALKKHLCVFDEKDIEDITPQMLNSLLMKMAAQKYSYSSISKVKITFSLTMSYAIIYENLPLSNYTTEIKIPKNAVKGKVHAPDDDVIESIKKNAEKVKFGMWAMIELCTGMRRGEMAALRPEIIDFDNNIISIKDSVEFIYNKPHLKPKPKTESSIGEIPILDILKEPLKKMCIGLKPTEFLFGKEQPLSEAQIKRRWSNYCKSIGHTFTQHQLRHAYATLLYRAGIDPKTMQALLRHADFSTTMDIYTDFAREMNKKSVCKLNKLMNNSNVIPLSKDA